MNLYEINSEIDKRMTRLGEMLENGETVSDDEALKILGLIDGELKDKLKQYRYVLLNTTADEQALDNEIKRLQAKKKAKSNTIERLKNLMLLSMQNAKVDKFDFDIGSLTVRDNNPSVRIDIDAEHLPSEFVKVKYEANKMLIAKALKDGKEIQGVTLETKQSLRVA